MLKQAVFIVIVLVGNKINSRFKKLDGANNIVELHHHQNVFGSGDDIGATRIAVNDNIYKFWLIPVLDFVVNALLVVVFMTISLKVFTFMREVPSAYTQTLSINAYIQSKLHPRSKILPKVVILLLTIYFLCLCLKRRLVKKSRRDANRDGAYSIPKGGEKELSAAQIYAKALRNREGTNLIRGDVTSVSVLETKHGNNISLNDICRLRQQFPESYDFHSDWDLARFINEYKIEEDRDSLSNVMIAYRAYCSLYRTKLFVSPVPIIRRIVGWPVETIFDNLPARNSKLSRYLQIYNKHFLEVSVINCDREGRPVIYMRGCTSFNVMEILRSQDVEVPLWIKLAFQASASEATIQLCEYQSKMLCRRIDGAVQVMDLQHCSLRNLIRFVRSTGSKMETKLNIAFFPGIIDKIIVINPPRGVGLLWNVLKPFLPSSIKGKVNIVPNGREESLLSSIIEEDKLPSCYGGRFPFFWSSKMQEISSQEIIDAIKEIPQVPECFDISYVMKNDDRFKV